ncbi:MAG: transcription-repair coupling factor [Prevotellaceae bacterium]|nr:transcription-repair coupling factor [Prevotellaceae bacterium]
MTIQDIQTLYGHLPQCGALVKTFADDKQRTVFLQGLQASATPMLFASVFWKLQAPVVFILDDADEAGYFYYDLKQLLGDERVFFFPSSYRRAVKYGQRDHASEILRTETLARLDASSSQKGSLFVVTFPDALAELVVAKDRFSDKVLKVKTGDTIALTKLEAQLGTLGFTRQDYVYEPGQFAVRGSILDVYSYSCEYPYRIDFFGDEVDTIRTFEVDTQLSKDKKDQIEIVPELAKGRQEKVPFLQFLPEATTLVMKDFMFIHDRIGQVYQDGFSDQAVTERLSSATEVERKEIEDELKRDNSLCTATQFTDDASRFRRVEFGHSPTGTPQTTIPFHITPQPLFHKNFDLLSKSLQDYILKGYHLYIFADSQKQTERLKDIFASEELQKYGITFVPVDKTLHAGFVDDDLKVCFFTDHQIFDRFHKYSLRSDAARAGKVALSMKELQEMEPGDFIVHVDYGVGKFGGLVRVPIPKDANHPEGGYQEMIRILYQHNDIVDVSIHSLYKISKYRSSDTGEPPRLSALGTGAWDRLKEKAKKKIKDIARDLIRLYAQRRKEKGFAFSPDNYMQHELEASFLYEDTPDQYQATQDVKKDMESNRPMDRLICGDVGFGKTEVAIRAAFKAACDSKQVAVLVPTTVLAFQHYQTFRDRLKDFPVRVDYLSRARSTKETKGVLADLAAGKVDILVGTHKLLGKTVHWHDLGLLIIDEEQKFGVSTKEKLRKLKVNVDTLTMSATPIPRTLQFSLMGARDMSIMRTPPPNRYPVHTELATFGHEIIADAINFEMSRNGQVYFVSDRINGLQEIADLIHKYVPDCRVAIGHGQMNPDELEKIIMGFMNYDYDVLLSTTIVENGIDIPNANTIIINDAHRFGLSDLHQMRGRVGRSNRKAFCYLLAPPKSVLNPEARRRLEALENFSDLGSGFNLAMQDLDIRGAGNLLGAEQSGFMEDLGYETYQKILSQAVTELKNEEFQDIYKDEMANGTVITGDDFVDDCAVESDLEMYFPDNYVPGSSERMLLYRELDRIETDRDLEAYRKRLEDRFGPVPAEGEELMEVVRLRRYGKRCGCEKVILKQGIMQLQFVSNVDSPFYQSQAFTNVLNYATSHVKRAVLKEKNHHRLMVIKDVHSVKEGVEVLKEIG